MLLQIYLFGWLAAILAALIVPGRQQTHETPAQLSYWPLVVVAGALWPVLVVGLVQLVLIALLAKTMRATTPQPDRPGPLRTTVCVGGARSR
jgi:hypothetical protein